MITMRQFFEKVKKAEKDTDPKELDKPMRLYVDNARSQAEYQSGEWGDATRLLNFYISGDCVHVQGG